MASRKSAACEGGMVRSPPSSISAWETPWSSDQMQIACLLGSAIPACRSRSVLSPIREASNVTGSGIDQLLAARHPQCIDDRVQSPVQHVIEVVHRQVDPMIGDAALGKVIGPDLGRPVTGANHRPPLACAGSFLLRQHPVEQASAKHFHGFDLVLELGFLILL